MSNGTVRRRWRLLFTAWALCVGVTPAVAQTTPSVQGASRPVRVHYRGDATSASDPCFSNAQVQTAVSRALKRTVFFEAGESDVIVELQARPGWGARVRLLDSAGRRLGTRHLRGKDCSELRELVVFTLAVMVDFRLSDVPGKRNAAEAETDDADELGVHSGADVSDSKVSDSGVSGSKVGKNVTGEGNTVTSEAVPTASEPGTSSSSPTQPNVDREAEATNDHSKSNAALLIAPNTPVRGQGRSWPVVTPSLGVSVDAGATPLPRAGVYGAVVIGGAGAFAFLVRVRGEHMLEVSRAGSQLSAWAISATLAGCWGSAREEAAWSYRACLGLTPDWVWVVAQGDEGSRTTGFAGLAAEPNVLVSTPSLGTVALELGAGLGMPVVRNSWHAATPSGAERTLFRAADVRLLGFVGGVWGR